MTELIWSPQAFRDLEGIRAYIALDSPRYADLTVRRVVEAVERLKVFPESGRAVPERAVPDIPRSSSADIASCTDERPGPLKWPRYSARLDSSHSEDAWNELKQPGNSICDSLWSSRSY